MTRKLFVVFMTVLIAASVFAAGCALHSGDGRADLSLQLDSIVEQGIAEDMYAGAVLLVAQNGDILHHKAYGFAQEYEYPGFRLAEPIRMRPDHIFDLASLTKVFATTNAIMLLNDIGVVDLDAPVADYLDEFAGTDKAGITVRMLLTHTSGLTPWAPIYYHARNSAAALKYIAALPLKYPVGKERHYSDLGFMTLGYLVERVTDRSPDRFTREMLYEPLGLEHTGFTPKTPQGIAATSHGNPFEKRMVADDDFGFKCDEDPAAFTDWREYTLKGEVNDGNSFYAHQGVAGHAGLFSTARDLKVLMELLLNKGMHNGVQVIRPQTVETFLTANADGHYLGWAGTPGAIMAETPPPGAFGHTGFTGTNVLALPQHNTVLIFLTNRQNVGLNEKGYYPNLNALRRKLAAEVIGFANAAPE